MNCMLRSRYGQSNSRYLRSGGSVTEWQSIRISRELMTPTALIDPLDSSIANSSINRLDRILDRFRRRLSHQGRRREGSG